MVRCMFWRTEYDGNGKELKVLEKDQEVRKEFRIMSDDPVLKQGKENREEESHLKSVAVISIGLREKEERQRSDLRVPMQVRRRRSRQALEEARRRRGGGDGFHPSLVYAQCQRNFSLDVSVVSLLNHNLYSSL